MKAALAIAATVALATPALAQQRIPVGHLMDNSGATSDVGVPYGQGVADTLAWVNPDDSVTLRYRPVHLDPLTPYEKGGIDPKKIAPKARVY